MCRIVFLDRSTIQANIRRPAFPHVAWASDEAMQIMADQLIDNIEAFVRGAPRNTVT